MWIRYEIYMKMKQLIAEQRKYIEKLEEHKCRQSAAIDEIAKVNEKLREELKKTNDVLCDVIENKQRKDELARSLDRERLRLVKERNQYKNRYEILMARMEEKNERIEE